MSFDNENTERTNNNRLNPEDVVAVQEEHTTVFIDKDNISHADRSAAEENIVYGSDAGVNISSTDNVVFSNSENRLAYDDGDDHELEDHLPQKSELHEGNNRTEVAEVINTDGRSSVYDVDGNVVTEDDRTNVTIDPFNDNAREEDDEFRDDRRDTVIQDDYSHHIKEEYIDDNGVVRDKEGNIDYNDDGKIGLGDKIKSVLGVDKDD